MFQAKQYTQPLCLPERPVLEAITVDEQRPIDRETLRKVGENDLKLKYHIRLIEQLTIIHNQQFEAKCVGVAD